MTESDQVIQHADALAAEAAAARAAAAGDCAAAADVYPLQSWTRPAAAVGHGGIS